MEAAGSSEYNVRDDHVDSKKKLPILTDLEGDLKNIGATHLAFLFETSSHVKAQYDEDDAATAALVESDPDLEHFHIPAEDMKRVRHEAAVHRHYALQEKIQKEQKLEEEWRKFGESERKKYQKKEESPSFIRIYTKEELEAREILKKRIEEERRIAAEMEEAYQLERIQKIKMGFQEETVTLTPKWNDVSKSSEEGEEEDDTVEEDEVVTDEEEEEEVGQIMAPHNFKVLFHSDMVKAYLDDPATRDIPILPVTRKFDFECPKYLEMLKKYSESAEYKREIKEEEKERRIETQKLMAREIASSIFKSVATSTSPTLPIQENNQTSSEDSDNRENSMSPPVTELSENKKKPAAVIVKKQPKKKVLTQRLPSKVKVAELPAKRQFVLTTSSEGDDLTPAKKANIEAILMAYTKTKEEPVETKPSFDPSAAAVAVSKNVTHRK